jgi:putative addiction module killer protein
VPFRDWLKSLDIGVQARIQARVLRFETGNLGDHKSVGDGVREARLDFGPGYRLYFARVGSTILLLAGGDKASQAKDIAAAKQYWNDFKRSLNVARRSRDWNAGLAQDLRDPYFAREFLMAAIEEGVPIQVALGKVIRAIGVKELSAKVGIASSNLLRAIHPRHNPTQDTLNRLLKPFKLKLSLAGC